MYSSRPKFKAKKGRSAHCSASATSAFHIYRYPFLYPVCQTAQTKAQEMGGTERDSRWAATIKGTLTQADAQVVQAFSFHVAYTSGNNAGKCTFSVCPHCSLRITSCTAPSIKSDVHETRQNTPALLLRVDINFIRPRCNCLWKKKKKTRQHPPKMVLVLCCY